MALTVVDVSFAYPVATGMTEPVLSDVSLSVETGGLTLVVGPSGSGKTTLLRLASGILEPSSGTVEADGSRVRSGTAEDGRLVVGIAFQRPESQLFATTVLEDVGFGPRNLGASKPAAETAATRALIDVGLAPERFGERSPFTLSGGEARRAALAGVLAMEPRYLLLDEPTAGLDAAGRDAVRRAVARARERAGLVVVTHDPEEFLAQADSVVVLAEGRPAYSGDVTGLLAASSALQEAGAWTPPEVVRLQLEAIRRGRLAGPPTADPVEAARALAGGGVS